MKNKVYLILVFFILYLGTYFLFGKNNIGLEIIENTTFKKQDSIQIQLFNLEDYRNNQKRIVTIIKNKGFKNVKVNYADNFLSENDFIYWLKLEQLTPFINFSYDGTFKKNEIIQEFESIYVWCFFKWIRVYKAKKV